jgi:hypothetical protein
MPGYKKGGLVGKLCSDPRITNTDLYVIFYQHGYRLCEIARLFGKNYHSVRESVYRRLYPDRYQL